VRRARCDKKLQLKDLKVTFTDRVRMELEMDLVIQKEGPFKYVNEAAAT
jgi:hypothetical protein